MSINKSNHQKSAPNQQDAAATNWFLVSRVGPSFFLGQHIVIVTTTTLPGVFFCGEPVYYIIYRRKCAKDTSFGKKGLDHLGVGSSATICSRKNQVFLHVFEFYDFWFVQITKKYLENFFLLLILFQDHQQNVTSASLNHLS